MLHALIIGINDYPKHKPLKGAVADAEQMESFLTHDLGVPLNHIISLRNNAASRAKIIQGFQTLRDDPRIKRGDPILIFYAGHGGSMKAPDDWRMRCGVTSIQVIFPFDYGVKVAESSSPVNCIPDHTIAALLNELAAAKGDNITVIFDSCHSASGSREDQLNMDISHKRARSAEVQFDIPCDIDDDVVSLAEKTESRRVTLPFCTNQSSHIHISACGSEEMAWEEEGRGRFTVALLNAIRTNGVDKITYYNLINSLPTLPRQSPHCYGLYKSRILFNSRVSPHKSTLFPITIEKGELILQAGSASGVTFKSVWELRESLRGDSTILGNCIAETPNACTTLLKIKDTNASKRLSAYVGSGTGSEGGTDTRLYARLLQSGSEAGLRVYFSSEAKQVMSKIPVGSKQVSDRVAPSEHEVGYVGVECSTRDGSGAHLVVESHHPKSSNLPEAVFRLCDPQAEKYGVGTLKYRTPAQRGEIETVLFAAAKWNWHLRRENPVTRMKDMVSMEMMKVAEKTGREINNYKFLPKPGPNLISEGVADFVVQAKDLYGIQLKSRTNVPLYVRMFCFNAADFSIDDVFGHSIASGRADPELPACGQLLIGGGGDGEAPLPFELPSGAKLELGYMKVFWSTRPLELDDLAQESAFDMKPHKQSEARGCVRVKVAPGDDWGTLLLLLVQRAPPKNL